MIWHCYEIGVRVAVQAGPHDNNLLIITLLYITLHSVSQLQCNYNYRSISLQYYTVNCPARVGGELPPKCSTKTDLQPLQYYSVLQY